MMIGINRIIISDNLDNHIFEKKCIMKREVFPVLWESETPLIPVIISAVNGGNLHYSPGIGTSDSGVTGNLNGTSEYHCAAACIRNRPYCGNKRLCRFVGCRTACCRTVFAVNIDDGCAGHGRYCRCRNGKCRKQSHRKNHGENK